MFDTTQTQTVKQGKGSKRQDAPASSLRFVPFESTGMQSTKGLTYKPPPVPPVNNPDAPAYEYVKGYEWGDAYIAPRGIPTHAFKYSPKVMDALEWLKIVRADDKDTREGLRYLHNEGNRAFGTDGHRIHAVQIKDFAPRDLTVPSALTKRKKSPVKVPNLTPIIPTHHETIIQVSRYDILRAIAACVTFAKESSNILRLSVTPFHLMVSATSYEHGDCQVTIAQGAGNFGAPSLYAEDNATYKMTGDPIEIAFNYLFLQDALKGMPEVFEMGFNFASSPRHIWADVDGIRREAIVMPMHIGR